MPSRDTLFTGHYPSLHGVTKTDGLAKPHNTPAMRWPDSTGVPTMGEWFRAGRYRTHYRGKWHISYADLPTPGSKAQEPSNAVHSSRSWLASRRWWRRRIASAR